MEYGSFWKTLKEKLRWLKWIDPFTYSDLLLQKIDPDHEWQLRRWLIELATAFISAFLLYTIIGWVLGTAMPLVIVVSGSMEPILHRGDVVLLQGIRGGSDVKVQEATIDQNIAGKGFWDFGTVQYFPSQEGWLPDSNACVQQRNRGIYSVTIEGKEYRFRTDGDIVVYFSGNEPIIHRAVLRIHAKDGDYFLTKGDSVCNPIFDQDCGRIIAGRPECGCIALYPIPVNQIQGKAVGWIQLLGYVKLLIIDDTLQFFRGGCPPQSQLKCQQTCYFP